MLRVLARLGLVISVLGASPAFAFSDPTSRGPLADFLNLFRQQAVPRELVGWSRADKPGTVRAMADGAMRAEMRAAMIKTAQAVRNRRMMDLVFQEPRLRLRRSRERSSAGNTQCVRFDAMAPARSWYS